MVKKTERHQKKFNHQYDLKAFSIRMVFLLIALLLFGCERAEIENPDIPFTQKSLANAEKAAKISTVTANFSPCYWADLMIQNVTDANNIYSTLNTADVVTWSGVNGAAIYYCKTDCSGLLKNLLKQTYGYTDSYFKTWTGTTNPYAVTFYNEIKSKDHFSQVLTVNSIIRGDIIAIKYPTGTNTGHIMLVASPPVLRTSTSPLVTGTKQYEISVMDASSSGHGSLDTRFISSSTFNDGIGRGIFRLYTNSTGAIVGYTWSTYSNSDYYSQSQRPLVIGRLLP